MQYRGCSSLCCTSRAVGEILAWLVHHRGVQQSLLHQPSYWCNSCLVGALETSAPPMDTTKMASTALISTT